MNSQILALTAVVLLVIGVVAVAVLLHRAQREAERPIAEVKREAYARFVPPAAAGHKLRAVPRDLVSTDERMSNHRDQRVRSARRPH